MKIFESQIIIYIILVILILILMARISNNNDLIKNNSKMSAKKQELKIPVLLFCNRTGCCIFTSWSNVPSVTRLCSGW